ncbi:MAG: hypothetical protein IKJ19_04195 [Clostridia bacterium]|nr:hypothetical protein [Clostridia bacterium]
MPTLKCPNCGCEISNESLNDINTADLFFLDSLTKVKIPPFFTGMKADKLCEVEVRIGSNLIWKGYSDSTVLLRLDKSCKVSFFIKEVYTYHPFLFFKNFIIEGNLQPCKTYEIKSTEILQENQDPTKLKYFLSEI